MRPTPRVASIVCLSLAAFLFGFAPLGAQASPHGEAIPMELVEPETKIVNGVSTWLSPSVVSILDSFDRVTGCTGTLIGCRTVLTAAHCFCFGDTANTCGTLPFEWRVFTQHGDIYQVESLTTHPQYNFGQRSDLAILTLTESVNGIAPSPINEVGKPSNGTQGTIVGFGVTSDNALDSGIKRRGTVRTAACQGVPGANHVCWNFNNPLGTPGSNSNTCFGDSGGPLFVNLGGQNVVAGVTSGGISCVPPDNAFDANVFGERNWIRSTAGSDIDNTTCGFLPQAGEANTMILAGEADLTSDALFEFEVPGGTTLLRFTTNGEDGLINDSDLYLRAGSAATTTDFDCRSTNRGTYEACEISNPTPGTWFALADRELGSPELQATATLFLGAEDGPCVPNGTTLCIDDEPDDRRFRVRIAYDTVLGGGLSGDADVVSLASLGIDRGGILSFFDAGNPEVLVKIIDGCGFNDHFWVFYAATTTAGFTLTVDDTLTGARKVYTNPDLNSAEPVNDNRAFATCP